MTRRAQNRDSQHEADRLWLPRGGYLPKRSPAMSPPSCSSGLRDATRAVPNRPLAAPMPGLRRPPNPGLIPPPALIEADVVLHAHLLRSVERLLHRMNALPRGEFSEHRAATKSRTLSACATRPGWATPRASSSSRRADPPRPSRRRAAGRASGIGQAFEDQDAVGAPVRMLLSSIDACRSNSASRFTPNCRASVVQPTC